MGSIYDEIGRLNTAKSDIDSAIVFSGGPSGNENDLIDTYADRIRAIPLSVLSNLNYTLTGGTDQFIKTIKQTNGLIEATTGGIVNTSYSGLVPAAVIASDDAILSTIKNQTSDWVLTKTIDENNEDTIGWYKLPRNAFYNTTYSTFTGATSTKNGTTGLVKQPLIADISKFLKGDGTWSFLNTSNIVALTDYSKATTAGDLTTSDSLNTALGKLEYKADYAYDFIVATMSPNEDSGDTIDRLKEVFDVLSGITETDTINALLGKYLLLTGGKMTGVITPTNNNTLTLGTSSLKWNAVYATTFHGALSGNATSATSASKLGSSTLGSTTKPIYLNSGTATECSTYAGGTAVTLNGTSKAATTASFYAPTTAGTSDYILKSNGSGKAPTWIAQSSLSVGTASKLGTNTKGSSTKGIYLSSGTPTEMTYSLSATINSGTAGRLAYYSGANAINSYSIPTSVGNLTTVYVLGSYSSAVYYSPNVTVKNGTTLYASGGFYESSDNKLKNFKENIKIDFEKLKQLPKKYFTWKSDETNKLNVGTSAQELQKLYPELVSEDENGLLHVAYDKLSIIALSAIDKLYEEICELKSIINSLQNK